MPLNKIWLQAIEDGEKPATADTVNKKILIMGPPKTGKTTFASTCPKPFYYNTDYGLTTVAGTDYKSITISRKMIDGLGANTIDILQQAIYRRGLFAKDGPYGDRKTFVFDSIHRLAQWLKEETMLYIVSPARDPLKDKPTFEHWGILNNTLSQIGDLICMLAENSMHVVGLIGVKDITTMVDNGKGGKESQKSGTGPLLDGQTKGTIGYWWDEVWAMEKVKRGLGVEYAANSGVYKDYEALGSRADLPVRIVDPTFDKVCEALRQKASVSKKVTPSTSRKTPTTPAPKRTLNMKTKKS